MAAAGVLFFLVTIPLVTAWRGYVLAILWTWFVVPTFGAPVLTIPVALGVSVIVSMLVFRSDLKTDDRSGWDALFYQTILGALMPAFSLLMGWVLTLFMGGQA